MPAWRTHRHGEGKCRAPLPIRIAIAELHELRQCWTVHQQDFIDGQCPNVGVSVVQIFFWIAHLFLI